MSVINFPYAQGGMQSAGYDLSMNVVSGTLTATTATVAISARV